MEEADGIMLEVLALRLVAFDMREIAYRWRHRCSAVRVNRFNVNEATTAYLKGPNRDFMVNACRLFPGAFTPGYYVTDPACGSVKFFRGEPTGLNLGGDGARLTGFVTSLAITEGFRVPARTGLIDAPVLAIPEPALWAMIIVGVGAMGEMTLRRAQRVTVAYA